MELPIISIKVPNYGVFISLEIDLKNGAGPDEMPHVAAFHLGLHCLLKYSFCGQLKKYFKQM